MLESEYGTTELAMNSSRFHGDQTLLVRFFMQPWHNKVKSDEEGRPIFEEKPYVEIMQPGNKDSIIRRPATERDKQRFPEHYKRFELRQDQDVVTGTPREEWPGITRSQVEELRFLNIRTVEQLAELADSNAQNIMGVQMLKAKAKEYLDASKEGAAAAELKAQKELNEKLLERIEALEGGEPAPQKRGRRRKTAGEEKPTED